MEINELSEERFGGIFRFGYKGDSFVEIDTTVQANALSGGPVPELDDSILAANFPLLVPLTLRISGLELDGILTLVVSKSRGVTVTFKNDPLKSVVVSSTFDDIPSIRRFLQMEIEKQLRNMFI